MYAKYVCVLFHGAKIMFHLTIIKQSSNMFYVLSIVGCFCWTKGLLIGEPPYNT